MFFFLGYKHKVQWRTHTKYAHGLLLILSQRSENIISHNYISFTGVWKIIMLFMYKYVWALNIVSAVQNNWKHIWLYLWGKLNKSHNIGLINNIWSLIWPYLVLIWVGGSSKLSYEKVYHVIPYFEGIHKRKPMVLFGGHYVKPVQNGEPSNLSINLSNFGNLSFWIELT